MSENKEPNSVKKPKVKPMAILINETQSQIVSIIEGCGLPPCVLELILKDIYKQIISYSYNELKEAKKIEEEMDKEEGKKDGVQ